MAHSMTYNMFLLDKVQIFLSHVKDFIEGHYKISIDYSTSYLAVLVFHSKRTYMENRLVLSNLLLLAFLTNIIPRIQSRFINV